MLCVVEIDADERIAAFISFDLDDIDAAFEELDARYLAGEAAAHAQTWSVLSGIYAGLNRRELPMTTPDWVNVDHRRVVTIEGSDLIATLRDTWDLTPEVAIHIEAVHRLTDLGAVVTHAAYGTSQDGFDAEWRMIELLTFEGDLIDRSELFDEADLDSALARFDQLQPRHRGWKTRRHDSASWRNSRPATGTRWRSCSPSIISVDDRRRVVNAGVRRGRDAAIEDLRIAADIGLTTRDVDRHCGPGGAPHSHA